MPLHRRDVLKGVTLGAGATLLSPILAGLAAHAAGDECAARKRVIFVVQSNGINPLHLVPEGVKRRPDGRTERPQNDTLEEHTLAGKPLHRALEPLAPFRDRMALVQGLSGRIAEGGTGGHSTGHGCLGCFPGSKPAMGQTVDSALGTRCPGCSGTPPSGTAAAPTP